MHDLYNTSTTSTFQYNFPLSPPWCGVLSRCGGVFRRQLKATHRARQDVITKEPPRNYSRPPPGTLRIADARILIIQFFCAEVATFVLLSSSCAILHAEQNVYPRSLAGVGKTKLYMWHHTTKHCIMGRVVGLQSQLNRLVYNSSCTQCRP